MASRLPIITTLHALRGMRDDANHINGITVVDSAEESAEALSVAAMKNEIPRDLERKNSSARRYYDDNFSLESYSKNLAELPANYITN